MAATATKAPPKRWTLREVAKQEATLTDLRQRLEALAEEEAEIGARIAEALADGDDPAGLQEKRNELRDERMDLAGAEPLLAERIRERREAAASSMAEERIAEAAHEVNRIADDFPGLVAEATKALEAAVEAVRKVRDGPARQRWLRLEVDALAALFGHEVPDMEHVSADAPGAGVRVAMTRRGETANPVWPELERLAVLREIVDGAASPRIGHTDGDPRERAAAAVRGLAQHFDEESPGAEILAALENGPDTA